MQRKLKQLVSLLFVFFIFVSVTLAEESHFQDVASSHNNFSAINYCFENNIIKGYEDGSFQPDKNINRAEFIKIIIGAKFSMEEIEQCDLAKFNFDDVNSEQWFALYVCQAKKEWIVKGYEDGSFGPDRNINFAEAAKIMASSLIGDSIVDNWSVVWYQSFVNALAEKKAIPDTISSFTNNLSRGEMAEMIYRIKAEVINKKSLNYDEIVIRENFNLDNSANFFLYNMKTASGSYFWEMEELVFDWVVDCSDTNLGETKSYKGMGINADAMDNSGQYIQNYFISNGFEVDVCNISTGIVGSVTGYRKDKIVCIMMETITDFAEELEKGITEPTSDKSDIKIRCAEVW